MATLSYALEIVGLIAFFAAFSAWSFRYVFDHHIIRNYAHHTHYAKAHMNEVLERKLNTAHGYKLLRLDVGGDDDENAFDARNGHIHSGASAPALLRIPGSSPYFSPYEAHISEPAMHSPNKTRLHYIVGILFSVVVTLSCELVLLLMIQLFGSGSLHLDVLHIVITTLVVLATLVQPPLVIFLFVNQRASPLLSLRSPAAVAKTIITIALCGTWFVVLGRFGAIAHELGSADSQRSFLEEKTNEIILAGISITAVLSGVGCTLTPIRSFWTDKAFLAKRTLHTTAASRAEELQLNELIQSYNSTKMLRTKRQSELTSLQVASGGTVYNAPDPSDSLRLLHGSGRQFFNRMQSFTSLLSLTGSASEEQELESEIESLQKLQDLIYADLSKKVASLLHEKENASGAGSRMSRVVAWGTLLFSVYCVYRIVNVLFVRLPYHFFWSTTDLHRETNIIDDKETSESLNKNTKDALAITIAKIIQAIFGYLPISETQLINQVSFILSGSLFVCSFQNVLITFRSLGRFFPSAAAVNSNVKTWIKHLVVSEFLAIYVIATALLIRLNLPIETSTLMLKILSLTPTAGLTSAAQMQTEVEFIDTWFDKVFGVTCVVTVFVLAMKTFIENDNIYEGGYDEEMIIEGNLGFKRL